MPDFLSNLSIPPWALVAATGAIVAFWGRIQGWFSSALTHLVDCVKIDPDLAGEVVSRLSTSSSISRFGGRGYVVLNRHVRSARKQKWILARWLDKSGVMTFWVKHAWFRIKTPIWVDRGKEGDQMTFRFLRGTLDFQALLEDVIEKANSRKAGRFRIHRIVGAGAAGSGQGGKEEHAGPASYGDDGGGFTQLPATAFYVSVSPDDIGSPMHAGAPADLWWSDEAKAVLADCRDWNSRRQWYVDRGIPWRRGFLLHGDPGVGKTSLARSIAIDLDVPIYSIDLGSLDNHTLENTWRSIRSNSPCMVLIEDLDSVYKGRIAVNANNHLGTPPSFDCLLNCLDGAEPNDGILVMLSTNDLSKVDIALSGLRTVDDRVLDKPSSRPGRVDRVVRLPGNLDEAGRRFLASRALEGHPELVDSLVLEGDGDTPATFVGRVVQAAYGTVA